MPSARIEETNGSGGGVVSSHLSDPNLRPFLEPSFDPTDFLNASLPPLSLAQSQPRGHRASATAVPLAEVSASTQTLLSSLSAQTSRLSNTLTQLTDEILRSGARLAYEVEVLRGETLGLSEALTEGLRDDVEKFVPGGLSVTATEGAKSPARRRSSVKSRELNETHTHAQDPSEAIVPPYLKQLRTLSLVRDRLDTVIKVFGEALEWTIPPSEVSITSSFISVSAPEPGSESHSREEKGREASNKLREEVANLLSRGDDDIQGLEAATERVARLRELATVWKGTAEEKARLKYVESLVKMLEERQRSLEQSEERRRRQGRGASGQRASSARGEDHKSGDSSSRSDDHDEGGGRQGGYSFIDQLQRLRSGL
ncbi:MAG: hypothetical protein M4579_004053 [Chaenotheca gracillima]|nr:MAG: hypothetical protein M4579_004053 [Chaenotheca gracillima]